MSDRGSTVGELRSLDSGDPQSDSLVALVSPDDVLFSTTASLFDYVEVFVRATYGGASGEASLRISRRLRPDKVGVSIVPPIPAVSLGSSECTDDDRPPAEPFLIEGSFSSAWHCPNPSSLERKTIWTVNGETVAESVNSSLGGVPTGIESPASLGFGSGVVVPGENGNSDFVYGVEVTFVNSEGDLFAEGQVYNDGSSMGSARPLAKINGGEEFTVAQAGKKLIIRGHDANQFNVTDPSHTYVWGCTTISPAGIEEECSEELILSIRFRYRALFA